MSGFPTCQVCHQQFSLKGPATFLLPCLHAACETCVTSAAGGVISCSTCQRDVNLSETPLQKDVITEKDVLHLTVKQKPQLVLCTHEDDGNQAVCWCKACEDFLCENCQMVHDRFKITKNQIIEDVGDLQPESFDVDTYCTTHPKFILDIWDEQCCTLICRKCKDEEHAEHKTVDFDKAVETERRALAESVKEVQSSVTQQGSNLTTIAADLQASDDTSDNLTENISHTFNSLKTLINQREKELQIELQQHQEKVRRDLNEKKNTSEACQKKCQTTSDYISKTLKYSSRHDIMSLRHFLQSKTGECISSARAIVYESPPLIRFNTDGLEKLKSVMAGFGQLTTESTVEKHTNDCETQTEDWVSMKCEELKQKLLHLKTTHEKEIQSLKETLNKVKEEEKKGLYRLTRDGSDDAHLLNCICIEFSKTKYNTEYVTINTKGEMFRIEQTQFTHSDQRLTKYKGTSSTVPLTHCGSSQYFEVKTNLGLKEILIGNSILLEIGLAREEEQDQNQFIGKQSKSYSLTVAHCSTHSSISRKVQRHGEQLLCLPDTLENTPGTSATLHYGVVYDTVRSRIAFLDVKNEKIIGKIDNVDCSVALWSMFGIYNPSSATVSMSLVVGSDVDMTEKKKAMLLQSLS